MTLRLDWRLASGTCFGHLAHEGSGLLRSPVSHLSSQHHQPCSGDPPATGKCVPSAVSHVGFPWFGYPVTVENGGDHCGGVSIVVVQNLRSGLVPTRANNMPSSRPTWASFQREVFCAKGTSPLLVVLVAKTRKNRHATTTAVRLQKKRSNSCRR